MEAFLVFVIVILVVAAAAVFLWMRRRANPPPADGGEPSRTRAEPGRLVPPPEPQVLDRDTVLGRNRVFDPTNWDDTPDGSQEEGAEEPVEEPTDNPIGDDLPRFFDREYLERKNRGEAPEA